MQVGFGRRLVVKEKSNAKRLTPNVEFKVALPVLLSLCFMHECGVYAGIIVKSRRL
jgi:hypothetical protein